MTGASIDTWLLRGMGAAVVVLVICVVWLAIDRRRRKRAWEQQLLPLRDRKPRAGSGR